MQQPRQSPNLPKDALGNLGERISQARRVRGMTQSELGRAAGLGVSTVVGLEAGRTGVGLGALARVLESLGLLPQLDDLLDPRKDSMFTEHALRTLPKRAKG